MYLCIGWGILTAGSTSTAVTGEAEERVAPRCKIIQYFVWVKETMQCLFLRIVFSNSLWHPKLYLTWMSSYGLFNILKKQQLKDYLFLSDCIQLYTVSFSRASSTCCIVPSSGRMNNEVALPLYGISTTQQDKFSSLWILKPLFWCIILTLTELLASNKKSSSLVYKLLKGFSQ